jgi:LytS/YehU family sensor histidine kinase
MLQTLVENAIKHGVAPSIAGGTVRVTFRTRDDGFHECTVVNTGMPLRPRVAGEGTGLDNTDERLRQLYGSDCTLSLVADADGTRASFWFTGEALAQNLDR